MRDIWAFLLQTLTASGTAVLLLVVKAMFQDKLSPRWQFSIWGVLGVILLIPAGMFGRYALFNWPLLIESLKTYLTGSYSMTNIVSPFSRRVLNRVRIFLSSCSGRYFARSMEQL